MRIRTASLYLLSAFILCACTQNPARVVNKSSNWYGKSPYESSGKRYGSSRVGQIEEGPEVEDVQYADSARLDDVKSRDLSPTHIESRSLDAPDATPAPAVSSSTHIRSLDAPDAVVEPSRERPRPANESSTSSRDLAPLSPVSFEWPTSGGRVISHFGQKERGESNDGINIQAPLNEPIWASADGVVAYSGNELKGYGNMVILRHSDGWMSAYAHADSITVRKSDVVKQGDVIGYVGKSGGIASPQLHFGIRKGKEPVDPEQYLPKKS